MRARSRHFNARSMGAGLVLDSRYIDQADNTAVSTWADRSGNGWDATQANGINQPTYQANQIGGNGVVRFDGSNDVLNANDAAGLLRNVGGGTLMGVAKFASANSSTSTAVVFFSRGDTSGSTRALVGLVNSSPQGYGAGGRRLDANSFQTANTGTYTQNRVLIETAIFDWANSDLFVFLDGTQSGSNTSFQTNGNTSDTDSLAVRVGLADPAFNQYMNGDIGQAVAFPSALTAAQRKRVEHSAARSFKLSCN